MSADLFERSRLSSSGKKKSGGLDLRTIAERGLETVRGKETERVCHRGRKNGLGTTIEAELTGPKKKRSWWTNVVQLGP